MAIEIDLKPFQGLKLCQWRVPSIGFSIEIDLKPFQGLKQK